jgi:predicted unusual protein kinase regulating ubiquinone biosynthesis (AarF/ABC1/UbiB family)
MEFIGGIKVSDITKAKVQDSEIDSKVVTACGADLVLKQKLNTVFSTRTPIPGTSKS